VTGAGWHRRERLDVTPHTLERSVDLSQRVTRQLDRDATRLGCHWWETDTATVIVDLARSGPFVLALAAIARAIQVTDDPLWVTGDTSSSAAHKVAWEWVEAGIEPAELLPWLLAGCWDPNAARRMADSGIQPANLLDAEGKPAVWVEGLDGERIPLALAVADSHITAAEAVGVVRR
jgi:hypothetical protein